MKKIVTMAACAFWMSLSGYGQGFLWFDNVTTTPGPAPVTISALPGSFNPANGQPGSFVGSDYTASLYYLNGNVTDQAVFDGSNPELFAPADIAFSGTTGVGPDHGPDLDGAGLFAYGIVHLPTTGIVTVQVRAWYNGRGLYTSYAQALAAGQDVGESNPVSLFLATGTAFPPPLDGLLPFTVGIVPEPSTLALFGLGGFAFFVLRRRK
jgi:hypothetical protein